jgi:sporulation protein YlmC with PRC-barrel domain
MSTDTVSEIRGVDVITGDEGANLGSVSHIYIDPETKKLSALFFKNRKNGKVSYVANEHISLVGEDVVVIQDRARAMALEGQVQEQELGRRLRKLRGMVVTTDEGKNLGKLEDFEHDRETRLLSRLHLDEGRTLPIEADRVTIGPDTIIVPAEYTARVENGAGKAGFFKRVRGWTERGDQKEGQAAQ